MRGVTLKAPINEFSGSFFVTNSTDGELHDFWITEHCGEHRNVLMGQLPCNQPLCFKQWHLSLPVHNAVVQRQPWQSEAATRLSGGGPAGPERTATTGYKALPKQMQLSPSKDKPVP